MIYDLSVLLPAVIECQLTTGAVAEIDYIVNNFRVVFLVDSIMGVEENW